MKRRAVFCSFLLVGWVLAGTVAFAAPAAASTFEVKHTLAETDTDGEIDVRTDVTVPDGTASLRVTLPEGSDVYAAEGFRHVEDRTYEWTRSTNEPFLRYDLAGNETIDRGDGDQHVYAVTDDWALVSTPSVGLRWTGVDADVQRSQTVDGDGVAGPHISFLGAAEEYTGTAAGQGFRLVVPERADMHEDPADVLATYERAAERIDVGQRDDEVRVFVAPTGSVEWAATGVQRGDADLWVRDVERLDDARNTWIHEYVHTRQEYRRTEATRWTIEGLADYYAAIVTYEAGGIDYDEFRERMAMGADAEYDDVELSNPSTWEGNDGNYEKGALVMGHLDRRLRAEPDSSLDEVVASFNRPGEELTRSRFLDAVEAAGGRDVRSDAERFSETTATPEVWSQEEHVAAFGGADIRYEFDAFAVAGPYRQGSLAGVELVTGETLSATITARNVGTHEASYDGALLVDGRGVDGGSGTLAPGEEETFTVSHVFEDPGEYNLRIGDARATATVTAPGGVEVTDLAVDPTTAAIGEAVTLRATVAPADGRPGEGELAFTVDGETVATETVQVGDEGTVVTATTTFDDPGERTVGAGERTATVTVTDETVTPGSGGESTGSDEDGGPVRTPAIADGPGFAPGAAVLALLVAALLFRRE